VTKDVYAHTSAVFPEAVRYGCLSGLYLNRQVAHSVPCRADYPCDPA